MLIGTELIVFVPTTDLPRARAFYVDALGDPGRRPPLDRVRAGGGRGCLVRGPRRQHPLPDRVHALTGFTP
ncbi:hypothetical protein [Frankia gtarii]|uniref:hypothetical protein n=1 Tax=Frankia gtarii TaxID=2950102 RepID=UPI0021BF56A8|nr:hypothetical protein [Frankia gtarii]